MCRAFLVCVFSFLLIAPSFAADSRPSPKNEDELRERLKERVSLKLSEENTFDDLFRLLREQSGIRVSIDSEILLNASSPVCKNGDVVDMNNLPLRTALRRILRLHDSTYYLDDTLIVITSEEEARNRPKVKVYSAGDIRRYYEPEYVDYDWTYVIELLEMTIEPDSWGDYGTMMEFGESFLVIRQTDEVHDAIADLFDEIRSKIKAEKVSKPTSVKPYSATKRPPQSQTRNRGNRR